MSEENQQWDMHITMRTDGILTYRYHSYKHMQEDINKRPCANLYISACLDDYSKFIEDFSIPISIDIFISEYWNIIPYFALEQATKGMRMYCCDISVSELHECRITQGMIYMDKENLDVIEVVLDSHVGFVCPGNVYYFRDIYKKVSGKPMERMVNQQWQMKSYLITKTSQPLS